MKKVFWSFAVLILSGISSSFAQTGESRPTTPAPRPLLQDIKVYPSGPSSDDSLVKKTSSVSAVSASAVKASSVYAALSEVQVPGYSGILVQTLDGKTIVENGSGLTYNPASNVKIATAYAVLKTFGPGFRFATNVWTDGSFDSETGTLHGNLYVSGRDPVFAYEHGVLLANSLNRVGIRSVNGDLIVTDNFSMNFSNSSIGSGRLLFSVLDASKRSAAATKSWTNYQINSGKYGKISGIPSVSFTGSVYSQPMPSNVTLICTHESAPLGSITKVMMSYSNNFLAERLGDTVGGPYAVSRIVQQNTGVQPSEFILQTSSGLGINRVTPRAMMKLLHTLRTELAKNRMTFADIMPVAGIDKGTLENRFDTDFATGSVIGKTGTLNRTDGGVSALAGELNTRSGKLLFVIFNQHGSVPRFRSFQNNYVSLIQGQLGGAAPIAYKPVSFDQIMAKTKVTFPPVATAKND